MRIGVVFGTAAVGVLAAAFAFLPLVLRHQLPPASEPVAQISTFWAIPLDGGDPRLVARLEGQYEFPIASADGRSLLVQKPTALGKTALWALPLGEGLPRWVGTVPQFTEFSWSNDRTRFAFGDGRSIAVYDLASGRARTITRFHVTHHSRRLLAIDASQLPKWTPDGRSLVYFDVKQRLLVQDVASASRRVLATGKIGDASVSPDGRAVYVASFLGSKPAVSIPK